MNKFTKKIKAFTLSEMLVVLLLTVIVVGLAFALLNLVQKQMGTARDNYENGAELSRLRQVLWRDFRNYPSVYFSEKEQQLLFKNEIDQMYYTFSKDMVVRDIDTFRISFTEKKYFFEGNITTEGVINALELNTSKEKDNRKLFVYQENTAETYMKE